MTQVKKSFSTFGLNQYLLKALEDLKFSIPSPIQLSCIPYLLAGQDILGMAQTGSGKTAAFALPLLHNVKTFLKYPQILVLTPTRELSVQVAEAFSEFSKYMQGINVLALYGGQRYDIQLKLLKKGPQIIVGTPGRLLDHLKRGTLNLQNLFSLVIDEADEMLRMGFIADVKMIMSKTPKNRQTALFSATMPNPIKKISQYFMKSPKEIKIQSNSINQPNIKQNYWLVHGKKTDALIRFLEVESFSAIIIFVKTKNATIEVSEVLEKNGYNCSALNGDMNQSLREKTLDRLRTGKLDILIATDVAARGLDVDRISLVVNYDIPIDVESYIHRIGRTGRAGRIGRALLFVEYKEIRFLRNIERVIKCSIIQIFLPKIEVLREQRLIKFSKLVQKNLNSTDLEKYRLLLNKLHLSETLNFERLSAALLKMAQGDRPLIINPSVLDIAPNHYNAEHNRVLLHRKKKNTNNISSIKNKFHPKFTKKKSNFISYRIEVGKNNGVEIRHIVGAIANEGGIHSRFIGNIRVYSYYSIVELPQNLSQDVLNNLSKIKIFDKLIQIKRVSPGIYKNTPKKYFLKKTNINVHSVKINKK